MPNWSFHAVRAPIIGAIVGGFVGAAAALPPKAVTVPYRSGQLADGSIINNPFFSGINAGEGFRGVAVNNSGSHFVHVGFFSSPGFDQGVLDSNGGLGVPFLVAGATEPDAGTVSVPDPNHVLEAVYSTSINTNGDGAFVVRLLSGLSVPVTGIYFNKSAMPIRDGQTITAAGVNPGATWAVFDSTSVVQINDNNTILVGTKILEGGPAKFALIRVQLDTAGSVVSQTLIAKEGGPVGAGPDTWASLAIGPHTFALNNSGTVLLSGTTTAGVDGLFLTSGAGGSFVAEQGGTSPVAGSTWGPLAGSPVDLNNGGVWAVRATVAGQDSVWNETGDAGESFNGFFSFTANGTVGGGLLRQINGALSNDHDVDLYYIRVGNPVAAAQEPFTATTVPDPGSGFAGAAFDSVLYFFRDFHNANGAFRTGLGRSDNAAPGTPQSTLTAASLPNGHTPGTGYFIGISTPKARAIGGFSTTGQMWSDDPAAVQIAGGVLYWIDPSEGQIRRLTIATGVELPPLQIGVIPPQTVGQIAEDAPALAPLLALSDTGGGGPGSKLYFVERRFSPTRLKRCNLDGTNIETILESGPSSGLGGINTLIADSAGGKLYWSRPFTDGDIRRCSLDGTGEELLLTLDGTRVSTMAIDPTGGKIYFHEPVANSLNRCNLNGTSSQILNIGTNATAMTIDAAGRRLYIANTGGVIRRYNLDTSAFVTDLVTTNRASVLTLDGATGNVCWGVPAERRLRRIAIAGGPVEEWLSVGPDVGERPSEGPSYLDSLNGTTPFQRFGTAVPVSLPYQIKLSGVTAVYPLTVISRGNAKVILTGDVLPSTGPDGVTTIGALTSPIKIADSGLIAWRARWISSVPPTGLQTALFLDREEVIRDSTPAAGAIGNIAGSVNGAPYGFDLSPSGQYVLASTFNGSFSGAGNSCVAVRFDTPPVAACRADFNSSGAVTVQDIFDFLSAYFTSAPTADINGSGNVTVQDIFDYLALYFIGCS